MADAEEPLADGVMTQSEETLTNAGVTDAGMTESNRNLDESMDGDDTQKSAQARVESHLSQALTPVIAVSKVFSIFQQSARDAVRTCLEMILPFMGFAALFIGICRGSGLTEFLANLMKPMSASVLGLLAIGIICSIPGLSAVLGAGAAAAQVFAAVIGELIATGGISPALALPALFAINCQCACDFIPVGLGMTEAKKETTQVGIAAVTISRFTTGWIRILIALVCSIGLYA
jgi:PTS system glucitol/sorbitol-specific IIC component